MVTKNISKFSKMKKSLFTISLFSSFYFLSFTSINAAGTCQPLYGGGQYGNCPLEGGIVVNKTVQNPQNKAFVDNLGINDPKFSPDQGVSFQITVTNTSNEKVNKITVKDVFPKSIIFNGGIGTFDKKSNTLTFDIPSLNPNESKTITLSAKIVPEKSLSTDKTTICEINQATATVVDTNKSAQDTAQLCIQKGLQVFSAPKVTTTPSTGPEALSLLALIPTGIVGFLTRRKAKNSIA